MANTTNHETIVPLNSTNLLNVNISNVTKLTASNFLMWSRQVQALLNGYGLAGYFTGATVIPPATITNAEVATLNQTPWICVYRCLDVSHNLCRQLRILYNLCGPFHTAHLVVPAKVQVASSCHFHSLQSTCGESIWWEDQNLVFRQRRRVTCHAPISSDARHLSPHVTTTYSRTHGRSERKHRHIGETGLTLLSQASMPTLYWTYAFAAAVYLINCMPSAVLSNTSPYAKLFKQALNYHKLRVFGCACYPWLWPYATNKMAMRSTECTFIDYSLAQSAYLCLDRSSGIIYTSRHVQFIEEKYPFPQSRSPRRDLKHHLPPLHSPRSLLTWPLTQHHSYQLHLWHPRAGILTDG